MRLRAFLFLTLAALVAAGCAGKPAESGGASSNATTTPSTGVPAAFTLSGPVLQGPPDREGNAYYEDDAVSAHYEVGLTGTDSGSSTAILSFLVNGKVMDVQTISVHAGETRKFDRALSLANASTLHVEVKMGAARGEANATIHKWPRVGETLSLGAGSLRLATWTNHTAGVHLEGDASVPEGGRLSVRLLCLDAKGAPQPSAPQEPTPGAFTLNFASCPWPYGLAVSATDAAGATSAGRILFAP